MPHKQHLTIVIKLSNVSKSYGPFTAVDRVSLEVPPGSIFAFLGLNGAGKTTTIRMMAGILKPSSGSITLGGFDLNTHALEAKQIVGYVPDRPHLYPKLTGREFLHFICDLYRVPPRHQEQRIDAILDEYELTAWQHSLIESYSHGMKQRIALCGALVHEPHILIVDEPMVGLDPHGAHKLKQAFKRYARSGMTVFLSIHALHIAEELADYLAIIHHGSMLARGTLEDLRLTTGNRGQALEEVFLELTQSFSRETAPPG